MKFGLVDVIIIRAFPSLRILKRFFSLPCLNVKSTKPVALEIFRTSMEIGSRNINAFDLARTNVLIKYGKSVQSCPSEHTRTHVPCPIS